MTETLEATLAGGLALLEEGAADPGSPWRNLALATVGADGAPRVRTVVLRRFDPAGPWLEVHTDTRAAKHRELAAHPVACLHGWDAGRRVQLRATGPVTLHAADDLADAAWAALGARSRLTYRTIPGPGTALIHPGDVAQADEASARAAFCVVRLSVGSLEWLHLAETGHRRARFTWRPDGARDACWLVP